MQSGSQQQGPPPPGQGPCRSSSSSSPSPSSSSASMHPQQPHLQNQQQNLLQSFQQQQQQQQQQQFMRKSQGDEALMAYQAGGIPGVGGASNACGPSGMTQLSQQQRGFMDMGQQAHVPSLSQDDGQVKAHSQMQAQAYLQYAFQTAQNKVRANIQSQQQQGKPGFVGAPITDQDVLNNLKLQELMRYQAANQAQTAAMYKKTSPQMVQTDKPPMDSGQTSNEQKNEVKSQQTQMPQLAVNMPRPTQSIQNQQLLQNYPNNQQTNMAHLQALHAWAMEKNIDIFSPANAHMIPQILVQWQARLAALSKTTENNNAPQTSRVMPVKPFTSSPVQDHVGSSNGNVGQGNSKTDNHSSQGGLYPKSRSSPAPSATLQAPASSASIPNPPQPHHFHSQGSNHQVERVDVNQNGASAAPHSYGMASSAPTVSQAGDLSSMNHTQQSTESLQMQYYRQLQANKNTQSGSNERAATNVSASPQGNYTVTVHQQYGFTKMQLQCLKSQILAFRRLKRGEKTLPPDVLQTLAPPPLHLQQLQQVESSQDSVAREKSLGQGSNEQPKTVESYDKQFVPPNRIHSAFKEEKDSKGTSMIEERKPAAIPHSVLPVSGKDASSINVVAKEEKFTRDPLKKDQEHEHAASVKNHSVNDSSVEKMNQVPSKSSSDLSFEVKKLPAPNSTPATKDTNVVKRYRGPLFDVPPFGKKPVSNGGASLSLGYDIKDLLLEEGKDVFNRKRSAHLKKIEQLLSVKLDRKRIRPDLVVKLQIEERKLQLLNLQARLRDEVEQEQQEIMAMGDRPYRKFVRLCERQRTDLARQVQISQKAIKEKHLKAVFQWRKRLLEAHWSIRDARTTRNRGVAKYHERMLKEFSKRKDEDRNKRMEALKNNDVERYRQMLLEQQNQVPGDQQTRLDALQDFLSQTEEYLGKLGGKITAAKSTQEMEEAAMVAAAAARSQGLSEEEVTAAAACARQEVITRKKFTEMSACKNDIPMNKYYNLAHSIDEKVVRQPSMLRVGTLRDYQLVGLQWMLSLYNNKLNGILADEMGLGKTVQVMALIAYLIEFKGNYGPHLIIVPNAVMVNWKSELYNWLPTLSCIYYVGGKDQRNKLYSQEVCARKFNVLVTTYEYIMRDRSKLSRVDWRYIIIDEAQRMKDRESRLARDLDRFHCQRRLLLTGTPLQNDLQELWSLLNLLLPEVFDNRKAFQDWFSKPFQKDLPNAQSSEDDWLETEKKVIIINRLHQILEPFMLRRRVEDVEGSLPAKVPIVLRCKMSALQGAIYDWIKATGSIRLDPESEERRILNNSKRQIRAFVPLQNRCMELRKVCNHPFLNYPFRMEYHNDYIVRSCGKLWILDRILVKFHRSGHRVLLFSTMTKLLDILEEYLQWRHLQYRRIDGTTSLEDRETAIHEFNKPGSDCFVFLLSIRAAGRGLNLQSADTVVIYDPDPNPKNEEQAVARAHRIGQKREVRVIYMEAVVETIPSYEKEDELRSGGLIDDEDELAGKDRYMGSVESLVRNNIQQYKIDMADEVINAGCFDQKTTQEDRRKTLETLLRDEERFQETVHDVPSLHEVNRMIARSEEEIEMFDRMDEEMDWPGELVKHHQIPKWLRVGSREVNNATSSMSKQSLKRGLVAPIGTQEEEDKLFEVSPIVTPEKKSNNLNQSLKKAAKESSNSKKPSINILRPLHTSDGGDEFNEASMDEKDESSVQELDEEEEGEIREEDLDDEENSQDANPIVNVQVPFEDVKLQHNDNENIIGKTMEIMQSRVGYEREAESSESSFHNAKLNQVHVTSPAASIQKFGSLAAIEAKPATHSKTMAEELEEGEIVQSGDSHMECQQSESCPQEREEGDEEQVLQPKTKRKRTMRTRPRLPADKTEDKTSSEKKVIPPGNMYQQSFNHSNSDHTKVVGQGLPNKDHGMTSEMNSDKSDHLGAMSKRRKVLPAKEDSLLEALPYSKQRVLIKNNRCNGYVESSPDVPEHSTERLDTKAFYTGGSSSSVKGHMSDIIQKKCKTIYGKLHGAINLSKRNENPGHHRSTASHIDPRIIEQRLDRFEYGSVLDFATDVQLMLENISRHPNYPIEVKMDARRLQTVFLQRIVQTFPDVDFSSMKTRSLVSISHNTTCASPKQLPFQSRVHKSQEDLNLVSELPPTRHAARSSNVVDSDTREKLNHRENFTRTPKESKVIFDDRLQHKERGKGEKAQVTHPGDLVICKKKRKDRDKVGVKSRLINTVPEVSQPNRAMPPKDIWHPGQVMQQQAHGWPQFAGMEKNDNNSLQVEKDAQWAKPVKRLRTDTGKRRPSHI